MNRGILKCRTTPIETVVGCAIGIHRGGIVAAVLVDIHDWLIFQINGRSAARKRVKYISRGKIDS
jgi:hypothetical protein